MHPPVEPVDQPKKLGRALRFLRTACLVILLLVAAFYLIENWRGARAWKSAQARLAAAGESLDLDSFQPPPIKPEENFCATPALDGIGGEDDAAEIKQRQLSKLSLEPHSRSELSSTLSLTVERLDWVAWRRQLESTKHLKPPADEPAPARAVALAFQPHKALFDELIQAVHDRPHARFNPPLLHVPTRSTVRFLGVSSLSPFQVMTTALELKTRALIAIGDSDHAALLLPVLVRVRQSMAAEPSRSMGLYASLSVDQQISRVLLDGLRSRVWQEHHLKEWDQHLVSSALADQALHALRWEMADTVRFVDDLRLKPAVAVAEWYGDGEYRNFDGQMTHRRMLLQVVPQGWLLQHKAIWVTRQLDYSLGPLRDHGLLAWFQAESAYTETSRDRNHPPAVYSAMAKWYPSPWRPLHLLFADTDARLLRTACALERHYLRHQQYPETLAALQPDLMAEIPTDLDGQPLRYARDETNGRYRLWSVGPNLIDDWQGQPPPPPKMVNGRTPRTSPQKALDWVLAFPATPP